MEEKYDKKVDPGRCGGVTPHASKSGQRLLLEFETELEGLDKTGLNSFIGALKNDPETNGALDARRRSGGMCRH
jgi:hypothetical protein